MGLIKKNKKKKALTIRGGAGAEQSPYRPRAVKKHPPCSKACPSGNDIRGWLTVISLREQTGKSLEEACDEAFMIEMETNPMPSIMGRVCPHPCEGDCNRGEKDGAVGINSVERFIGDKALERGLKPPKLDEGPYDEKVAVVGSGPSGLSCAYQLARRGYAVTMFESLPHPGGMLAEVRNPDGPVQHRELAVHVEVNEFGAHHSWLWQENQPIPAVLVRVGAHRRSRWETYPAGDSRRTL